MDPARAERLTELLASLAAELADARDPGAEVVPSGPDGLVRQLVFSMLLWEASAEQARAALAKLDEAFVDANELRVAMPDEVAALIGGRYPRAEERCERLARALHDIFRKENRLALPRIAGLSKRDGRAFAESIDALPLFAAQRLALIGLGAHCVPVDGRIAAALVAEEVLTPEHTPEQAASELEHAIRTAETPAAYFLLEAFAASAPAENGVRRGSRRKSRK